MNYMDKPINCSGVFRVLNPSHKTSSRGDGYQAFEIYDGDKRFRAYAWEGQYQGLQKLKHGQKVYIQGKWNEFNGHSLLNCLSINLTTAESIAMRRSRKRARVLFLRLSSDVLKQFVSKVFMGEGMLEYFMTQPSTSCSTHNYPGGMLIQGVNLAWWAFQSSDFVGNEKDLAIVGYLLRDLGLSYYRQRSMSTTIENVSSVDDADQILIINDAVEWLDSRDEYLGLMIRHYLAWL